MSDAATTPAKRRSRGLTIALVSVAVLFIALALIGVVLRVAVYAPYRVPAGSMIPTIAIGEHIWTHSLERTPERGDIFVFPYPEHPDQRFIKRVVGLEGDVVELRETAVSINGWAVPRCDVGRWTFEEDEDGQAIHHAGMLRVEWLGETTYLVYDDEKYVEPHQGPYRVAAGESFVLGDNRENSHDSRMWFGGTGGGVPNKSLLGRVHRDTTLPPGAEPLTAAFLACLAKKPAGTSPPPASH